MERLDTSAFDEALTEISNIKTFFDSSVEEMISTLNTLKENWSGEAGHKFDVFYTAFKTKMTVDMSTITTLEENLTSIRQAYLDADQALADSFNVEE